MEMFPIKNKRILKWICLLLLAGILCISRELPVYAAADTGITDMTIPDSDITAPDTEVGAGGRTAIREPGEADTPDELKKLNIANELSISYDNGQGQLSGSLRILITLTLIGLAPILLLLLTSYTRIIIVLHFTRTALNTQTVPPNQILIALALVLTFFIMSPVITEINETALKPYEAGEMTQKEFLDTAVKPLRTFMSKHAMKRDAEMFVDISGIEWNGKLDDLPTSVLIPSFVVGELRAAFIMGFVIYIPFIVIDMVVASTLMSMGMMMLPPTTISMPFKILLFILADGWNLIIVKLVETFY